MVWSGFYTLAAMIVRFYRSAAELKGFQRTLKYRPCPHCRRRGFLILHGYLYGYDERGGVTRIKRGRRIFCSNRNKRRGCGRTFSLLAAVFIKNFILSTKSLWNFLLHFLKTANKYQAFKRLNLSFSTSIIYRVYQRFHRRQSFLRSRLRMLCPPPPVDDPRPLAQTIRHLRSVFPNASCPLTALQCRLQLNLF